MAPRPPVPSVRAEVDPECSGNRVHCVHRDSDRIDLALACGHRCIFGDAGAGTAPWYRHLRERVRAASGEPVYLLGARPGPGAAGALERAGVSLNRDFCRSVFDIPEDAASAEALMTTSGARDARRGDRAGLRMEVGFGAKHRDAFGDVITEARGRLGLPPLATEFLDAEQRRAEGRAQIAVALDGDEPLAVRLLVPDGGVARIVEGAAVRREGDLGHADAWLSREVLQWALSAGYRGLDWGIAPLEHRGLLAFKRRMGFVEDSAVVRLEQSAERSSRLQSETIPPSPPRPQLAEARDDIALLERCNFSCGFCYREPWVPQASLDSLERQFRVIAARGNTGVALSGGEPTLRPDLIEIIELARRVGIEDIQLHTHGQRIESTAFATRLVEAGLGSAMVSFHGHTPELFAAVTSTEPANFVRTLRGIDALRRAGVYVLLSHVINALNYRALPDFMEFAARRIPGAELFVFFVYPSVKGQHHPELYPALPDVEPYWYRALEVASRLGIELTVDSLAGLPLCYMQGWEHLSRTAWSQEQEARTEGRVDDHRLKRPEMRQVAACRRCKWADVCPGFWDEYLEIFGPSHLRPVRRNQSVYPDSGPVEENNRLG